MKMRYKGKVRERKGQNFSGKSTRVTYESSFTGEGTVQDGFVERSSYWMAEKDSEG